LSNVRFAWGEQRPFGETGANVPDDHETWSGAIRRYGAWLSIGASRGTVHLRCYYLEKLAGHCEPIGPFDVTEDNLVEFLTARRWQAETRKSARAAVRGFYRWALDAGQIASDPSARLPRVHVPPGRPRPTPEVEVAAALARADRRVALMIALAAYAGLRRGEIAAVRSDDMVGDVLRVRGKGDRVRVIPLPPGLVTAIHSMGDGYIFPGSIDGHLSADRVGKIVGDRLGPGWTPHTLRHRFASKAYEATRDIRAVQELLGHAKLETTQIYTAVPDGALRAAVMGAAAANDAA